MVFNQITFVDNMTQNVLGYRYPLCKSKIYDTTLVFIDDKYVKFT